jgi:hypothetical protein
MKITTISDFHIYNLLRVLEKSECMTESENELLTSQSTLLSQGVCLTNLISTVAKSSKGRHSRKLLSGGMSHF